MSEEKDLKLRVAQLEQQAQIKGWEELVKPDQSLADDEWWAIFPNYDAPITGGLSKVRPSVVMGNNSLFKVKRIL